MPNIKLKNILKQYKNTHWVKPDEIYKQVTISQTGQVSFRGEKKGITIGRKRQFIVNLKEHPNTLIFIRQGVYKGGIGICPVEVDGCIVTENMPMFEIHDVEPSFLLYYLKSPLFRNEVNKLVPIGTAQKALHENKLLEIEMPYPNKEKRMKIISKLDLLKENYNYINNNSENNILLIEKLRQAIITEALKGELIKIHKAQEYLLADLVHFTKNGYTSKPNENNKGTKRLGIETVTQTQFITINMDMVKYIDIPDDEKTKYYAKKDDLFVCRQNGNLNYVGKAAVFSGQDNEIVFSDSLIQLRPKSEIIDSRYLAIFLNSQIARIQLDSFCATTAGNFSINGTNLKKVKIPVYTLEEQKRIVDKVAQLMSFCNEVEKKVRINQKYSETLMNSVLRDSFEV